LRHIWHLATRFFGVVFAPPLKPGEQAWVSRILNGDEARLFWDQQAIDQRHAHTVAMRVAAAEVPTNATHAALLHDVGKRHSRLGPVGRSLATVADGLRLPMPMRWRSYLDHGALGARDLRAIGADPLAIAFAEGSSGVDPETLALLRAADDGVLKASSSDPAGNTMPPEVKR
jgi:hypothetical protein